MLKSIIKKRIFTAIAFLSMLLAAMSASACFPFFSYQPKMPESLIKSD